MDKFERVLANSQFALALLVNESTEDWELVEPEPVPKDTAQTYAQRGLCWGGVLGIVSGKPRVALATEFSNDVVAAVTAEFMRRFERTITHPKWHLTPVMTAN